MTEETQAGAGSRLTELLTAKFAAHSAAADILDGLTQAQAATKLPGWPYSVAEQVAHMLFWQRHLQQHIQTGSPPEVPSAAHGWPAVPVGDWEQVRGDYLAAWQKSLELLNRWYDVQPTDTVAAKVLSMVSHDSYHLGQIVLMRRLLGAWPPPNGGDTW